MRLTTRSRFAVTAMLELAIEYGLSESVSLSLISERHNLSVSYLEQLFLKLRKKSLVSSVRGSNGGYYLSRSPNEIVVADIIFAVDDILDATACKGMANCKKDNNGNFSKCITHDLWSSLNQKMFEYLSSISLQNLLNAKNFNNQKPDSLNYLSHRDNCINEIVFL
ncbi:MAG: Rrf2 family transcriptional regulator [Candidatus Kinetoplastibacterium crithidii]|nr:MAG: Rrf2 family transcriptional regulator [Candidatus Kinetoplastibacterium crithidii]